MRSYRARRLLHLFADDQSSLVTSRGILLGWLGTAADALAPQGNANILRSVDSSNQTRAKRSPGHTRFSEVNPVPYFEIFGS
jgi:hypothetical protein